MQKETDLERRILKAAEELFMRKGFAATKTTEIAEKAGCTHALLHYYYRTKEHLFEKVYLNKFSVGLNIMFGPLGHINDIESLTRIMIQEHLRLLMNNVRLPLFVLNELLTNPKRIELMKQGILNNDQFTPYFVRLEELLKDGAARGVIRPMETISYMLNIMSLTIFTVMTLPIVKNVLAFDKSQQQEYIDMRREEITNLVLNGILLHKTVEETPAPQQTSGEARE